MTVVVPDEVLSATELTEDEIVQERALALYQREKRTLGQAGQLAHMNQWEFQQFVARRRLPPH